MTDENSIATSGATGKEERRVIDDSFLECLASAESLIDKCPMRGQGDLGEVHCRDGGHLPGRKRYHDGRADHVSSDRP